MPEEACTVSELTFNWPKQSVAQNSNGSQQLILPLQGSILWTAGILGVPLLPALKCLVHIRSANTLQGRSASLVLNSACMARFPGVTRLCYVRTVQYNSRAWAWVWAWIFLCQPLALKRLTLPISGFSSKPGFLLPLCWNWIWFRTWKLTSSCLKQGLVSSSTYP